MTPPSADRNDSPDVNAVVLTARESLQKGDAQKAVCVLAAISPGLLTEEATAVLSASARALHLEKQLVRRVKEVKQDKQITCDEASGVLALCQEYLAVNPGNVNVQELKTQCRNIMRSAQGEKLATDSDYPYPSLWQRVRRFVRDLDSISPAFGSPRLAEHQSRKAIDMHPQVFGRSRKLIAIIVVFTAALLVTAVAAKNARHAYIASQTALSESSLSVCTAKLRRLGELLEADLANQGLHQEIANEIATSLRHIHDIERIEDEVPRAYWTNLIDALCCTKWEDDKDTISTAKASCDRSKILAKLGARDYWDSTGYHHCPVEYVVNGTLLGLPSQFLLYKTTETAERRRLNYLDQIKDEQALTKAQRYAHLSECALNLIRAWSKSGETASEIAKRGEYRYLAEAIALSDYRCQRGLLSIDQIDRSKLGDQGKQKMEEIREQIIRGHVKREH
jgi:hypothetical protein